MLFIHRAVYDTLNSPIVAIIHLTLANEGSRIGILSNIKHNIITDKELSSILVSNVIKSLMNSVKNVFVTFLHQS